MPRRSKVFAATLSALLFAAPYVALAVDPLHPLGKTTIETVIGRMIGVLLSLLGQLVALFLEELFQILLRLTSTSFMTLSKMQRSLSPTLMASW